jgi:hypothetical protein
MGLQSIHYGIYSVQISGEGTAMSHDGRDRHWEKERPARASPVPVILLINRRPKDRWVIAPKVPSPVLRLFNRGNLWASAESDGPSVHLPSSGGWKSRMAGSRVRPLACSSPDIQDNGRKKAGNEPQKPFSPVIRLFNRGEIRTAIEPVADNPPRRLTLMRFCNAAFLQQLVARLHCRFPAFVPASGPFG